MATHSTPTAIQKAMELSAGLLGAKRIVTSTTPPSVAVVPKTGIKKAPHEPRGDAGKKKGLKLKMSTMSNETQEATPQRRRCAEISTTKSGKTMITLRGSSFGGCVHSHIASLRGLEEADPPGALKAIFARGHAAEEWAKEALKLKGIRFIEDASGFGNQSQLCLFDNLLDGRLLRLAISPDGLCLNKRGQRRGVECKSFSRGKSYDEFLSGWAKNERYAWQFSAVIHAYRKRDRADTGGVIVPVICDRVNEGGDFRDPSGQRWGFELGEIVEVEEPPFTLEEVLQRCKDIVAAYDSGEWPKCVSKYPCRYPHKPPPTSLYEEAAIAERYLTAMKEWEAAKIELEAALVGRVAFGGMPVARCLEQVLRIL